MWYNIIANHTRIDSGQLCKTAVYDMLMTCPLSDKSVVCDWHPATDPRRRAFVFTLKKDAEMSKQEDRPLFYRWKSMKIRCDYPNHHSYVNYGGRGITICEGFRDFEFFTSVMIAPPFPKAQIDRIDNDGHYSCGQCDECYRNRWPLNLRWATPKQNANNRRARQGYIAYRDGDPFEIDVLAECLSLDIDAVKSTLTRDGDVFILTDDGMKQLAAMVRDQTKPIKLIIGEQLRMFERQAEYAV